MKKILVAMVVVLVVLLAGQILMVTSATNANAIGKGGGKAWCCFMECDRWDDYGQCVHRFRHCLYLPEEACGSFNDIAY